MKKKNFFSILVMLFAVMALSGCATLLSKKQTVTVTSDVDGAQVYKGKKFVGITPLTFQTKSAKSTFTVTKEGYEPQTINTSVAIRWNTLWNWLNGFYPGWLIDLAAGSTQKYTKTDYFVSLKDASINDEYNKENQHQYNTIAFEQVAGILVDAAAAGIAEGQQRQAEINQQKAEKEAQLRAEQQARIAQNNQQLAELKATSTRKVDNSVSTRSNTNSQGSYSDADVYLLARLIYGEARGESYVGQVAVGAVVLNRVASSKFPSTVSGVIYQQGAFDAVEDGQINLQPSQECYNAARDAMNGWDPSGGALYYFNPATATNKWIWSRPMTLTIGKHRFCK